MIFLVVPLIAFVVFAASFGYATDIKDGLKDSKKPVPQIKVTKTIVPTLISKQL